MNVLVGIVIFIIGVIIFLDGLYEKDKLEILIGSLFIVGTIFLIFMPLIGCLVLMGTILGYFYWDYRKSL